MRVTVKLFATLVRFKDGTRAGRPFEVELHDGAIIKDLIDYLKIPPEETHVVFINNIIEEHHSPLKEGDVVGMFPPVGGGQMDMVTVDVRLYGELSCYGKVIQHTRNYSTVDVHLPTGSTLKDLMDYLLMCTNERGFTFINEKMSAMPNRQPDLNYVLKDGDRVLFFPLKMLPTHLHFEMKMTEQMTRTVRADDDLNLYYLYE